MNKKTEIMPANKDSLPAMQSPAQITPVAMLQLAQMPGTNIENLGKLMEFQERWEANEARKAFNKALGAFKAEALVVSNNAQVAFDRTAYKHATLDNVCNTLVPALSKQGLSHRWETSQDGSKITVTCILAHELGHFEKISLSSEPDSSGKKNAIQSIGSAVKYLQRYTLLAITGTATTNDEDDDDGIKSGEHMKDKTENDNNKTDSVILPDVDFEKYCADILDKNDPGIIVKMGWKSKVEAGITTSEKLIEWAESKCTLSENQKNIINSWGKK